MRIKPVGPAAVLALAFAAGCGGNDLPGVDPPPMTAALPEAVAPPAAAKVKAPRSRRPRPEVKVLDPSALRLKTR